MRIRIERVLAACAAVMMMAAVAPSGMAQPKATPAPGGAGQRASVNGCMGEWLFNGIWRMRVLKAEPISKSGRTGWGLTVDVRNGSKKTLSLDLTGVHGGGDGIDLVMNDGNTLELDVNDFQTVVFRKLPQGGGLTYQVKFYYPRGAADGQGQPAKFLVEINPQVLKNYKNLTAGAAYTVKNPSLRVRMDCTK